MRTRIRDRCEEKADCGRQCALSTAPHDWHVCEDADCEVCHAKDWTRRIVRGRVDTMDVATLALAGAVLLALWLA